MMFMNFKSKMKTHGGTDKVTHHKYHEIYPIFFEKFENTQTALLEIGLEPLGGKASLKMWLDLFPNMHIYGVDIGVNNEYSERYSILQCDQSNVEDLKRCANEIKHPLSIIVDDGSHLPEHQLLTFNEFFPLLETGGVYVIEDIETSYWTRGNIYTYLTRYGKGHPASIVEIFKGAIDGVNFEFSESSEGQVKHQRELSSVTFSKNCIIITKREPESREYRFKQCL